MENLALAFFENNPTAATILICVGALRVVLKPLMVYLEAHVAQTPEKTDDEKLAKIKASKAYKIVCFVLDYVASVKLPK